MSNLRIKLSASLLILFLGLHNSFARDNQRMPAKVVKLVFIHHSCGENWLSDDNGGLAAELQKNNYFVSDTNYGWGPDSIGDRTDILNWPEWFLEDDSTNAINALLNESGRHSPYERILKDPGGENRIIMFKSCFPNSNIEGNPGDKGTGGTSGDLTVANAKGIYIRLLQFFAKRQDKLFVVVTAPPVSDASHAKNARAFNNWLVHEWLKDYKFENVAVFDFYNVLTGKDARHRISGGKPEHTIEKSRNTLYYPAGRGDDHPSKQGNRKATEDFVPMLNHYCNLWLSSNPPEAAEPYRGTLQRQQAPKSPEKELERPSPPPTQRTTAPESLQDGMIDDFKGAIIGWELFRDDEKPGTSLVFNAAGGGAGMQISFNLPPESWATCAKILPKPQDWSRWKALSIIAEGRGEMSIFIYEAGKGDDGLRIFEKSLSLSAGDAAGAPVLIPIAEFRQPGWQGDPDTKFNPKTAKGVALHLSSDGGARKGSFTIKEIKLVE